jgi:CheY-like chemotaxis protein
MDLLHSDLPAAFEDLLRDALLHLYDPGHLHGHRLLGYAPTDQLVTQPQGKALRQALLDAMEALRPGAGVPTASRTWRLYHILEFRYIEGQDVAEVIEQTALSKSQYHREHQRALQAVASVLWEKWGLSAAGPEAAPGEDLPAEVEPLAQTEAQHLLQERGLNSINVGDVARGVARLIEPLARQHGVALRLQFPDDLPDLRGDRVALRHALLTLLTPIIHRSGGGTLELRAEGGKHDVTIDLVTPLGEGAASEAELAESRSFVEALGGRLTLQAPQRASQYWRIRLQFPCDDRPALMVVDNNADFLRLIERYLAGQAWQMVGATDADRAMSLATRRRPAAILLDVVIPERDGWELLQDLKTAPETRDIPVAVCSVLYEPDVAIALGATAYLRKPISQHQLLEWLGSLPIVAGNTTVGEIAGSLPAVR